MGTVERFARGLLKWSERMRIALEVGKYYEFVYNLIIL
jgi:hypothetical protein